MFERKLYVLVDPEGLRKENFIGRSLVDNIMKRGQTINVLQIGNSGDVHAFEYGDKTTAILYIPREYVKYFDSPIVAGEMVDNIIPFPTKPATAEESLQLEDIWCRMRELVENHPVNTVLVAHAPIEKPIRRIVGGFVCGIEPPQFEAPLYESAQFEPPLFQSDYMGLSAKSIQRMELRTLKQRKCEQIAHLHLEAKHQNYFGETA